MLQDIVHRTYFQNELMDYLIVLLLICFGYVAVKVLKSLLLRYLKRWSKKTATTIDDFLIHLFEKSFIPLLYYGVFYISIRGLILPPTFSKALYVLGVVLLTFFSIRFLSTLVQYSVEHYWLKSAEEKSLLSFKGIFPALKVVIWGLGIVFLLDNLGFKISTVIAGLGIGGIAVAMASQAILGDLFSYFAILFDRPFETGDFIIVGDYMGAVEHIGIKTTRICSLGGEQLVFSNTDLTNSRVRNYKRMERRRVVFKLGVIYDTSLADVKNIPGIIKRTITNINDTIFDRTHFVSYGDFSLIYEVVYYVIGSDYNKYMDIQQAINFTIKEEFEKAGIEFAYPTQTLYLNKSQENRA